MSTLEARREAEERARRDRDERERRDRDERERRKQRDERERLRQRSPLRNGAPAPHTAHSLAPPAEGKEERKEAGARLPPPPLAYAPPTWEPYRPYEPAPPRFNPLVEAALRAEEDRVKMLSAYAAHHPHALKPPPALLHRPLAPPPPLDLLKKEEPR